MRLNPLALAAGVLTLLVAAGCQSTNQPSPKSLATKQWNAARASVLYSLAKDQYQSGQFDKCRHTLDDALRLASENPGLHILAAKLAIEQGQLEAAERSLKLARQFAPNDAEAHYLSGVVFQRWQKPEVALDFYRAAAERSPAELAYWLAQAEMLVALDRTPEALALLQGKVDYFEHSGAIRDAVGQLLLQLGRTKDAAASMRQASILSEDDVVVRERLAFALYLNHEFRDAADVLVRLVGTDPFAKRADLFLVLGECQLQAGRPRDARASFETAANIDAQSGAAWRGVGRAALEGGDLARADLALAKSLRLDAAAAETHLLVGYVRLRQNRLPDARAAFERASALDPADTVSVCLVGYVLEKMGDPAAAAGYYARAARAKPGDDLARQLMAGVNPND